MLVFKIHFECRIHSQNDTSQGERDDESKVSILDIRDFLTDMAPLPEVLSITVPLAVLFLSYIRYKEYVNEVQRDLFVSLEGEKYPRTGREDGPSEAQFEVVNVDVETSRLMNWHTVVILQLERDEFPWEDCELDDFDYDMPEPLNPPDEKDVDTIDELMGEELLNLCRISRKSGPEFRPVFTDSVYGPALFLHFSTTNLFDIKEQLEMVSNSLPLLFSSWLHTTAGLDTDAMLSGLIGLANSPEMLDELDERDE